MGCRGEGVRVRGREGETERRRDGETEKTEGLGDWETGDSYSRNLGKVVPEPKLH